LAPDNRPSSKEAKHPGICPKLKLLVYIVKKITMTSATANVVPVLSLKVYLETSKDPYQNPKV
jgi:hypothetical protein